MKYIFILLIISCNIFSQDLEPAQVQINFNGFPTYLSPEMPYFQQNDFILGWHWGGPRRISDAVLANQRDIGGFNYYDTSKVVENAYMMPNAGPITHGGSDMNHYNVRALMFEPTLRLDPNDPEKLVTKIGDTTRPTFGFTNIRGRILTDDTDPDLINSLLFI